MAGKVSAMLSKVARKVCDTLSGESLDHEETTKEKNRTATDLKEIALEALRRKADAEAIEKDAKERKAAKAAKGG